MQIFKRSNNVDIRGLVSNNTQDQLEKPSQISDRYKQNTKISNSWTGSGFDEVLLPCPPAHKACIPLHVPVTNHHTDLAKNRATKHTGNIIFKLFKTFTCASRVHFPCLNQGDMNSVCFSRQTLDFKALGLSRTVWGVVQMFQCQRGEPFISLPFPYSAYCACTNRLVQLTLVCLVGSGLSITQVCFYWIQSYQ